MANKDTKKTDGLPVKKTRTALVFLLCKFRI